MHEKFKSIFFYISIVIPLTFDLWAYKSISSIIIHSRDERIGFSSVKKTSFKDASELIAYLNEQLDASMCSFSISDDDFVTFQCIYTFVRVTLPGELAYVLGYSSDPSQDFTFPVQATNSLRFTAQDKANIFRLVPNTILVYADFVQSNFVGSTETKLLKVVHLENKIFKQHRGKMVSFESEHLDFLPLAFSDVTTLQLSLRTISGQEINFGSDVSPVHALLMFSQ